MPERIGRYTLRLPSRPLISGYAAVVGKKEGEGPLSEEFDYIYSDTTMGEQSWEKAESAMLRDVATRAINKAGKSPSDLDFILGGDLLNQCIGTTYGIRSLEIPYFGLFGACSTMAESLALGGILTDSGASGVCLAITSSHFCSAERQFRFPLEYGGQRPPSSQWTVSGSGGAIITNYGSGPRIDMVTIGKIMDYGIKDANNMGAAMAPAAADTIQTFLRDTNSQPSDYEMILTGDLGAIGSELLLELLSKNNVDIEGQHNDCGLMIYDLNKQDVNSGGSGCGCSATIICSYILKRLKNKELKNVLFVGTGALMSPTSIQQGESVPGIAHAVLLSAE